MGRKHDPQPPYSIIPQRPKTNRVIAMGHVSRATPASTTKTLTPTIAATPHPNNTPQQPTRPSQPATSPTTRIGNSPSNAPAAQLTLALPAPCASIPTAVASALGSRARRAKCRTRLRPAHQFLCMMCTIILRMTLLRVRIRTLRHC